jgi:hypothetical protein
MRLWVLDLFPTGQSATRGATAAIHRNSAAAANIGQFRLQWRRPSLTGVLI